MSSVLLFIVILSLLVLVHEAGHFFTALWTGMKVEEFGIGFPPRLFSWKRRNIRYSINWIPIGGFVKIKGETGEDRNDPEAFVSKAAWKRLLVLSAGVIMNAVLAVVLLTAGFIAGSPQVIDETTSPQAVVQNVSVQVYTVLDSSPAKNAGLAVGDQIVSIDDNLVSDESQAQTYIQEHENAMMRFSVKRGDTYYTYDLTPTVLAEVEGHKAIGIGMVRVGTVSYPWYLAPVKGVEATVAIGSQMIGALVDLVRGLIVEHHVSVDLSGPVGIAMLTGQVAQLGFSHVVQFAALLSINLAIINFIPFPALDGGRALFVLIEKVRGKPVSAKAETITHNIGFGLLMILILVVTYRDVIGLIVGK